MRTSIDPCSIDLDKGQRVIGIFASLAILRNLIIYGHSDRYQSLGVALAFVGGRCLAPDLRTWLDTHIFCKRSALRIPILLLYTVLAVYFRNSQRAV